MGKNTPFIFYNSFELEGHIVHNYLIDSRVDMTIVPKKVSDIIGLFYTRCSTRVLQLDGTNAKTLRVVKDVPMKLHKYLRVSIIQDIIVVYIPLMFSLFLSS